MIKFGTGGFRGVIGDTFTRENIERIAEALVFIANEEGKSASPIAVGYDRRFMSETAANWFAEVLLSRGIDVILCDRAIPTPAVMFTVSDQKLYYGAMITASHNPYYFNGIKIFTEGGVDANEEFTKHIENIINKRDNVFKDLKSCERLGEIERENFLEKYLAFIRSFLSDRLLGNKVGILYDAIHGVGAESIFSLAQYYRFCNFTMVRGDRDAFFGGSLPNPTNEIMQEIYNRYRSSSFDYIMATDSDADRLGIVDEYGNIVDSNEILGIIYYYLHKYRQEKGGVVKNCATSLLLDKLAEKFGEKCYEVDVGFKNISQKMKDTDALVGGESSGGLTVRGYIHGKDSVFSSMLFAEIVSVLGKPVSQIVREVREFAGYSLCTKESVLEVDSLSNAERILRKIHPDFKQPIKQEKFFGRNYKYEFENGWALMRLSGTEPVLRLFVETESESQAENIMCQMKSLLKENA